jgi:hypothetical protein
MPFTKGSKHTEAVKQKMRDKKLEFFKNGGIHPRSGKKLSDESKRKLSASHIGKKPSLETRSKLSEAHRGSRHWNWQGGLSQDLNRLSWIKNKRNRVIKRLKIESLSHTFGEWELLKKQYGFTCPSCKGIEPNIVLTEDHIVPLSRGGTDLIENIQPLCLKCNMKKHTKIIKY